MPFNSAEFDTVALRSNIHYIRSLIGPQCRIMATVKANGYGMGALPMTQILLDEHIEYLGVATVEEGLQLRQAEIDTPILIYGAVPRGDFSKAIFSDLTLTIYSFEAACLADYIASQLGKKAKIHIKLDTGMHRLGFLLTPKSLGEIKVISEMPHLELEGIYSHLSQADNDRVYTERQIEAFRLFIERLAGGGVTFPLKHLANSEGTLHYPASHFDMVRPGIVLHGGGVPRDKRQELRQTLTLKSAIVRLYRSQEGDAISYGGTYVAPAGRLVATVPLGYADGYFRHFSNKAEVLVHGQRAPIVGRVCMDQFMIDVTAIENVAINDEVVLYGAQGDEIIHIDDLAALIGTVPHEILTALSRRVSRYYIFEDDD